jgi:hypothetical protein
MTRCSLNPTILTQLTKKLRKPFDSIVHPCDGGVTHMASRAFKSGIGSKGGPALQCTLVVLSKGRWQRSGRGAQGQGIQLDTTGMSEGGGAHIGESETRQHHEAVSVVFYNVSAYQWQLHMSAGPKCPKDTGKRKGRQEEGEKQRVIECVISHICPCSTTASVGRCTVK